MHFVNKSCYIALRGGFTSELETDFYVTYVQKCLISKIQGTIDTIKPSIGSF